MLSVLSRINWPDLVSVHPGDHFRSSLALHWSSLRFLWCSSYLFHRGAESISNSASAVVLFSNFLTIVLFLAAVGQCITSI